MAQRENKNKAINLRLKGYSYSQIKSELGISKSTLSGWLAPYPLSKKRIKELRDWNPERIENYRNTMAKKKEARLKKVYQEAKTEIGKLNKRELFLAGLFLYWGEGYKTAVTTTALGNTDPSMVKFFIKWLKTMNIPVEKMKVRVHIYNDMDQDKAIKFWQKELNLPQGCFNKVYIKKSKLSDLSYKNGFGKGTCNVLVHNRDLNDYVLASLKYLREEVSVV